MNIVAQLRQYADATARATQMIADAKSSRNEAAGDVGASYSGLRIEETVEWKAADEIERLRALVLLGDFSSLRPNSDSFKLVQQIRRERSAHEQDASK